MKNTLRLLAAALTLSIAAPAYAHIQLTSPERREDAQKGGPCGSQDSTRGDNVTTLIGGSTYTLKWRESINHPAHYRISLDPDGQDGLIDPSTADDYYNNDTVLVDEIADKDGGLYEQDIDIPDIDCENCTIQLIQVMYDKAPYGDGNDLYYQCADIIIISSGNAPADMGPPDMGPPGCTSNADCESSEFCNKGLCEPLGSECTQDAECNGGTCSNGTCMGGDEGADMGADSGPGDTGSGDDEGCSSVGTSGPTFLGLLWIVGFGLILRRRALNSP